MRTAQPDDQVGYKMRDAEWMRERSGKDK